MDEERGDPDCGEDFCKGPGANATENCEPDGRSRLILLLDLARFSRVLPLAISSDPVPLIAIGDVVSLALPGMFSVCSGMLVE